MPSGWSCDTNAAPLKLNPGNRITFEGRQSCGPSCWPCGRASCRPKAAPLLQLQPPCAASCRCCPLRGSRSPAHARRFAVLVLCGSRFPWHRAAVARRGAFDLLHTHSSESVLLSCSISLSWQRWSRCRVAVVVQQTCTAVLFCSEPVLLCCSYSPSWPGQSRRRDSLVRAHAQPAT